MWGAVIGDIVGSCYEFDNIKTKNFPLFSKGSGRVSTPTDDTICTVAIADAIIHGEPFSIELRKWCRGYPEAGYGAMFNEWLSGINNGPYNSWGNGAPMRTSPCALLARNDKEALVWAKSQSEVTHNHPNAIHGAMAITHAIRMGLRKEPIKKIRSRMEKQWGYDLKTDVDHLRHSVGGNFDVSSGGSVKIALVSVFEATSFEDAIRNCISLGGDCDTTAAIAGPLAEVIFGIPEEIKEKSKEFIPYEILKVLELLYSDSRSKNSLSGDLGDSFDVKMFCEEDRKTLTGDFMFLKLYSKNFVTNQSR